MIGYVRLVIVDLEGRPLVFLDSASIIPRVGEDVDVDVSIPPPPPETSSPLPKDPRPVISVVHVPRCNSVRVTVGPRPASAEEAAAALEKVRAHQAEEKKKAKATPKEPEA